MNVFVGFVIPERKAYWKCNILQICSVSVPRNYAYHALEIRYLCITRSLFSPKLVFIFINHTFELLDSFFIYFSPPIIYVLACHLSYNLCFSWILILGWTVVERAITPIEVNSQVSVYLNCLVSKVPISVIAHLILDNSK